MRIAVCDDEKEQRELLVAFCKKYDTSLLVDTYFSALDLLMASDRILYDIIFMDIEMPPPNGFEVATTLKRKKNPPLIIFVSKSSNYTIQGYGIAFRYLQKPVSYEVFETVFTLAVKEREPVKILFVSEGVLHILSINEIIYCEAFDHSLTVHTKRECYTSRMPLSEFLAKLPAEDFAQPHKSFIVNLNYVQSVETNNITLTSNSKEILLPLSKGKRKYFIQKLGDYIGR